MSEGISFEDGCGLCPDCTEKWHAKSAEVEHLRAEVATWRARWEQMQERAERAERAVEAAREADVIGDLRAALARYDGREE